MEHQFQVTLPSNASLKTFPENKPHNYTTLLASPIDLDGTWEVALVDIQYPNNWNNFRDRTVVRMLVGKTVGNNFQKLVKTFTIDEQNFPTIEDLIFKFNTDSKKVFGDLNAAGIELYLNKAENRVCAENKLRDYTFAEFGTSPKTMMDIMGFQTSIIRPPAENKDYHVTQMKTAERAPQFENVPSMYIYTDIIQYQMVGDVKAPLLGVLPVKGSMNEQVFWNFNPPYYIPINRNSIPTIQIRLCTETGLPFPIAGDGKVICRLHFRRRFT